MEKEKGYVVVEMTLQELEDKATANTQTYDRLKLFECPIDRGTMSPEQLEIQQKNKWYTERNINIRLGEDSYYEQIKQVAYKKISDGCKDNLINEIQNSVMATKLRVVATIKKYDNDKSIFETDTILGEDDKYEYSNDLDEFKEKLKDIKYSSTYNNTNKEFVYLEYFDIHMYSYAFNDVNDTVRKLIKKFIRNELTYCLKNGRIIIPDEYLAKGKEGIEEWRKIKSSSNKNNSMEKRMIKQVFADKKKLAYETMRQIVSKVANTKHDWSLPSIVVDGQWNKAKMNKLVTQLADTKDKQKFIDLSEEEMTKKFKDYWKNKLMEIYKEVDEMEIEK